MNTKKRWKLAPVLTVLAFLMAITPNLLASCGLSPKAVRPTSGSPLYGAAHLVQAAYPDEDFGRGEAAPIVGMWHVIFTAKTMNGASIPNTVIDNALVVWHSDKTEIMNSARPPQDGDFCMGVWERTDKCKYKLNHFAWGANAFPTDPPTAIGPPVGPVHYVEKVELSEDGKRYSGVFTLDAYDTSGNVSTSFTGTLSATRVTVDTKVPDLL